MKYPNKRWGGASPVGERQLRVLDSIDVPFLTSENSDSYVYKNDEFSKTIRKPQSVQVDGFYCLGDRTGAPPFHITGSATAKGKFAYRGVFDEENSYGFALPNLLYIGVGIGVVPRTVGLNVGELWGSRNGKSFKLAVNFNYTLDENVFASFRVTTGANSINPNGSTGFSYGLTYLLVTDPSGLGNPANYVWTPTYLYVANSGYQTGATLAYPGFHNGMPYCWRVGPRDLVMLTPVYDNPVPPLAPYPFFSVSRDNGATWTFVDAFDLFDPMDIPPGETYDEEAGRAVMGTMVMPDTPSSCIGVTRFARDTGGSGYVSEYRSFRINLNTAMLTVNSPLPINAGASPSPKYDLIDSPANIIGNVKFVRSAAADH